MTKKNELEMVQEEVRTIKATLNSVINWISAAFGVDLSDKGKQLDSDCYNRMEFRTSSTKLILPKPPPIATANINAINFANTTPTPVTTVHVFSKDDPTKKFQQSQPQTLANYGILNVDSTSVVLDSNRLVESYNIPSGSGTHSSTTTQENEVCETGQTATVVNSDDFTARTLHEFSKSDDIKKESKKRKRKPGKPKPPKDTAGRDDESGSSEEPIQCEMCGKFLSSSVAMKRHLQTHRNSRPYSCQECGKSFQRNFHLKTHLMIHSGEKKHQCRFCGRLFLLPKDLICHERTHTGEKPFECSYCSRKFNLKSHLTMHTRTHTGEKPYKCDLCDKTFSQSNSLRVHKKTHTKVPDGEGDSGASSKSSSQTPAPSTSSSNQSQTILDQKVQTTNEEVTFSRPTSSSVADTGNNAAATGSLYENIHVNLAGHLQSGGAQLVAILEPGQTVNMPMPITFRHSVPSQTINMPIAVRPPISGASINNMNTSALESRVVWLCPDDTTKRITTQNPLIQ